MAELEAQLEGLLARWRMERDKASSRTLSASVAGLKIDIPLTRYSVLHEHILELEEILGYE